MTPKFRAAFRPLRAPALACFLALPVFAGARDVAAQQLDSLNAVALRTNPALRAARARVEEARAGITPAGALDDPMLMAGIVNVPIGGTETGQPDMMTMKMIGLEQTIPIGGKRALRREIASHETVSAEAARDQVERIALRDLALAYIDVAAADSMLHLLRRDHRILRVLADVSGANYAAGLVGQQDPLRAEVELVRLSGEVTTLRAMRARAVARVNAVLAQPATVLLAEAPFPERIVRSGIAGADRMVLFTDSLLGASAIGSPLPALDSLHQLAVTLSPQVHVQRAEQDAQAARVRLLERDARPDPTVSLQYGQRDGRSDMISALVRIPLPVRQGSRQQPSAAAGRAALDALGADEAALVATLIADVTDAVHLAELHRTRLALYHGGILPRARAAADAALAGYRTGSTGFEAVLDTWLALFRDEAQTVDLLADFARSVLAIEALVGQKVLP